MNYVVQIATYAVGIALTPGVPEAVITAIAVGNTVRTTVNTISWAADWAAWAFNRQPDDDDDEPWQYVDGDFILETAAARG